MPSDWLFMAAIWMVTGVTSLANEKNISRLKILFGSPQTQDSEEKLENTQWKKPYNYESPTICGIMSSHHSEQM